MELSNLSKEQFDIARNAGDLAGIDSLRQAAHSGDAKALDKAAAEFEAIFVRMMLKSMRQAQDALADDKNPMNSQHVKFFRDMHDHQLASDLAAGNGLGLAELIVQQLGPQQEGFLPASVVRSDANLPLQNTDESTGIQQAYKAAGYSDQNAFVEKLLPAIEPVARSLGIDARALLAQAALETGWGQHMIHSADGQNSHNLFGIKANSAWQGEQTNVPTVEYRNGIAKRESAAFRMYDSVQDSVSDYMQFLQQGRYADALNKTDNAEGFFRSLQRAGYATDPDYADKVLSIMKRLVKD